MLLGSRRPMHEEEEMNSCHAVEVKRPMHEERNFCNEVSFEYNQEVERCEEKLFGKVWQVRKCVGESTRSGETDELD